MYKKEFDLRQIFKFSPILFTYFARFIRSTATLKQGYVWYTVCLALKILRKYTFFHFLYWNFCAWKLNNLFFLFQTSVFTKSNLFATLLMDWQSCTIKLEIERFGAFPSKFIESNTDTPTLPPPPPTQHFN